jgi:hypothetical protein
VNEPRHEYERRLANWDAHIARGERTHFLVSNLRLAVAALAALLGWLIVQSDLSAEWLFAPAICFAVLVVAHARVLNRLERARRARALYERGVDRLEGRWAGTGRDGARFLDGHPYARDLDLFGRASLFELVNTARTEAGEETLAGWLRAGVPPAAPVAIAEVRARQAAVDELRPMADFREELSVLAAEAQIGRTGVLAAWGGRAPAGFAPAARFLFAACGVVTAVVVAAAFNDAIGIEAVTAWLLVPSTIALLWRRRVRRVLAGVDAPERDLELLSVLLECIERQRFTSPRLSALRGALATGRVMPSRRIGALARLMSWLDSTRNQFFAPVAALLMLRSQIAAAIDRWHASYGPAVGEWLRVAGELEALAALATYAYEHPADPFPVFVDGPLLDATALGHPLLDDASVVRNDVRLGGSGPRVLIVSGSNMSGKSTLLRAIGVNVVLAQAGAPVRAASLRMSPLSIGATLRIEDSLEAGQSRFYAEILRIRAIVELARGPVPALFLLDEILHGTNSYDRRIGAEAIIRALVGAGAIGLVTTHDLALTELASTLGASAANVHFEDRLEKGVMVFDYRMRPGVVEHSNALALMRAVGLDV